MGGVLFLLWALLQSNDDWQPNAPPNFEKLAQDLEELEKDRNCLEQWEQ